MLPASSMASLPGSASWLLILRDTEKMQDGTPPDDVRAGVLHGVKSQTPCPKHSPHMEGITDEHLRTPTQTTFVGAACRGEAGTHFPAANHWTALLR